MNCEIFIKNLINILSWPNQRLQDSDIQTNLIHVLTIRLTLDIQDVIKYFIDIKSEYKKIWNNIDQNISINERKIEKDISVMPQYMILYQYLASNNYLLIDELEWLDDALHEVLVS